jgi:hypothetical protein
MRSVVGRWLTPELTPIRTWDPPEAPQERNTNGPVGMSVESYALAERGDSADKAERLTVRGLEKGPFN